MQVLMFALRRGGKTRIKKPLLVFFNEWSRLYIRPSLNDISQWLQTVLMHQNWLYVGQHPDLIQGFQLRCLLLQQINCNQIEYLWVTGILRIRKLRYMYTCLISKLFDRCDHTDSFKFNHSLTVFIYGRREPQPFPGNKVNDIFATGLSENDKARHVQRSMG